MRNCIMQRKSKACSHALSAGYCVVKWRTAFTTNHGAMPGSQSMSVDETKNLDARRQGVPSRSVRRCEARNCDEAASIEAKALTAMAVTSKALAESRPVTLAACGSMAKPPSLVRQLRINSTASLETGL